MTATDLAERYGAPASWRRPVLLAAVAVVVLAFGGWLAWAALYQAEPTVASGELRYEIVDDHTVSATFTVDLSGGDAEPADVRCELVALAEDKATVGSLTFTPDVGAGGVVTRELRTTSRATAVDLVGCTAPGQNRPR